MSFAARFTIANAYAVIALAFGAFFLVLTPPFGVSDETAHFERSYEIATGRFLGADGVPAGMQRFMDDAFGKVKSGEPAAADDFARWRRIDMQGEDIIPYPEPLRKTLRLHSPLCYAHLAPPTALALALDFSPFAAFYLLRLTALLVGVCLIWLAIRRAPPALRTMMAFAALLPTVVVFLAALNIESLLVGLGFYFFALVAAAAAEPDKKLSRQDILLLAGVAFALGQFKTGYLLLPLFALALPASKFESAKTRALVLALICLPGMIASLAWAIAVKEAILGDIVYSTMNGNHVEPSAQLAYVLKRPIEYAVVIARTVFASDAPGFAWKTLLGVAGWTNIPVATPIYALLTAALLLIWMSGEKAPDALTGTFAATAQISIFALTALAILTLVYFQWNGVGARIIEGFQGRYLIAALPLLFAIPPIRLSLLADPRRRGALAFSCALVGLIAMAAAVRAHYYG